MLARVNLVPQEPLADRLKILVPLLLLVGVGLVVVLVYFRHRLLTGELDRVSQEVERISLLQTKSKAEMSALQQLAGELADLRKRQTLIREEVAKIEAIRMEKRGYTQAISTIAGSLPGTVKCDRISFRQELGTIEGVTASYRDLPPMVKKLRDSPPFKDASLDNVDKVVGNPAEPLSFRIQVTLEAPTPELITREKTE
jgi:Tfp pilus assembly protein PilN